MIRGDHVIENDQPVAFFCLIQPLPPGLTVFAKLEQEFPFMTPMRQVPHLPGEIMPFCSRHLLNHHFWPQKDELRPDIRNFLLLYRVIPEH